MECATCLRNTFPMATSWLVLTLSTTVSAQSDADDTEWEPIFAYVCFGVGGLLILFGFGRIIHWLVHRRKEKEKDKDFRMKYLLERYHANGSGAVRNGGPFDQSDGDMLQLDASVTYSQPRHSVLTDETYNNFAFANGGESDRLPHVHEEEYRLATLEDPKYETITRTLRIDQSGTTTPASGRAGSPVTTRSVNTNTTELALEQLDQATAGEGVSSPRSPNNRRDLFKATSNGNIVTTTPHNPDGTTFYYRTYSNKPLGSTPESNYTFVSSAH